MTDIDINQTNIISICGIQNTATEIPSVCSTRLEINTMMSFDVQTSTNVEITQHA